jgi:hypothetical protein
MVERDSLSEGRKERESARAEQQPCRVAAFLSFFFSSVQRQPGGVVALSLTQRQPGGGVLFFSSPCVWEASACLYRPGNRLDQEAMRRHGSVVRSREKNHGSNYAAHVGHGFDFLSFFFACCHLFNP